ncbi:hypothetical protein [Desulfosporosinus fructosivorans]
MKKNKNIQITNKNMTIERVTNEDENYLPTAKGLRGNDGTDPFYLSTLTVAELAGEPQTEILVLVSTVLNMLKNVHVNPTIFFLESSEIDSKGKKQDCYLITKEGCECLVHLLEVQGYHGIYTGILKGVLEIIFNDIEGARANGYIATA